MWLAVLIRNQQRAASGEQPAISTSNLRSARGSLLAADLLSRNNRGLDVPVAIHHVLQDLLQPREWRLARNVFRGTNLLFRDQGKSFAHAVRRVVERRLQRYLGIMQAVGV